MTHLLDADDLFIHRVQQHCAERGMNFFLIEPLWVEVFHDYLATGKVWARVLLNMHSEHHQPEEIYHRLVRLATERHCQVIDPPQVSLAAFDKAVLHPRLVAAGVNVPASIIVSRENTTSFTLTPEDRLLLGTPFVVKPSLGYGRRGVILDATGEADLARSVAAWPDSKYLLQRRITPRTLGNLPAYFRVYYVFGSTWCCWWNCFTDHYRLTTAAEVQDLGLGGLQEIVCRIAALTGMRFFSSEIAQIESEQFVVIDYVNDQCHMLSQTANPKIGVPDELVTAIARRLVEGAQQLLGKAG